MPANHSGLYELDSSQDYPFVSSNEEHDRLNDQSLALNDMMFGQISQAPVYRPAMILDVGCGTGLQTRLLAQMYPDATIVGVDPNPVPDIDSKSSRVEFILGRIEEVCGRHALLQPASFDLIYHRYLVMAIKAGQWKNHIARMRTLLKPGGWVEFQEVDICTTYDEQEEVIQDEQFQRILRRAPIDYDVDFEIGVKIPGLCRELGFVDVNQITFPQVFRPGWTARPETEKMGTYFQWAGAPIFRLMISRSARPEEGEDIDAITSKAVHDRVYGPVGRHANFIVNIARKPPMSNGEHNSSEVCSGN